MHLPPRLQLQLSRKFATVIKTTSLAYLLTKQLKLDLPFVPALIVNCFNFTASTRGGHSLAAHTTAVHDADLEEPWFASLFIAFQMFQNPLYNSNFILPLRCSIRLLTNCCYICFLLSFLSQVGSSIPSAMI
jgi:hypothetical protein